MRANRCTRREWLAGTAAAIGAGPAAITARAGDPAPASARDPFRYCLNTSTIRGHRLTLPQEVEIAANAGYDAIEPWVHGVRAFRDGGGSLADLRARIADRGLTVESAISFARWIVDDDGARAKALEQTAREMELLAAIGGTRIAAPPAGGRGEDLLKAAERYRALLEIGDRIGVVPQVELWGPSQSISRLGQAAFVAIESGHPKACLLPDVYHIYKGGSAFTGLRLLGPEAIHVFHLNDYPADPPRDRIGDRDRVYPGDGIAPLDAILRDLAARGRPVVLSLELFNPDLGEEDPLAVARTGLEKMKAAVRRALG